MTQAVDRAAQGPAVGEAEGVVAGRADQILDVLPARDRSRSALIGGVDGESRVVGERVAGATGAVRNAGQGPARDGEVVVSGAAGQIGEAGPAAGAAGQNARGPGIRAVDDVGHAAGYGGRQRVGAAARGNVVDSGVAADDERAGHRAGTVTGRRHRQVGGQRAEIDAARTGTAGDGESGRAGHIDIDIERRHAAAGTETDGQRVGNESRRREIQIAAGREDHGIAIEVGVGPGQRERSRARGRDIDRIRTGAGGEIGNDEIACRFDEDIAAGRAHGQCAAARDRDAQPIGRTDPDIGAGDKDEILAGRLAQHRTAAVGDAAGRRGHRLHRRGREAAGTGAVESDIAAGAQVAARQGEIVEQGEIAIADIDAAAEIDSRTAAEAQATAVGLAQCGGRRQSTTARIDDVVAIAAGRDRDVGQIDIRRRRDIAAGTERQRRTGRTGQRSDRDAVAVDIERAGAGQTDCTVRTESIVGRRTQAARGDAGRA